MIYLYIKKMVDVYLEKKDFKMNENKMCYWRTTLFADDVDDELAVDEPRDEALCGRCPVPLGGLDPSIY
jgi:hypothetical protein